MLWMSVHTSPEGVQTEVRFVGEADDEGFLGKFSTELQAEDANDAEHKAYGAIAPLLSSITSLTDAPMHVETIQVTEMSTGNAIVRIAAPFQEMNFGGAMPLMSEDFWKLASLYREALTSNSSFYRFLCLFKVLEGSRKRRNRLAAEAKAHGKEPVRPSIRERLPEDRAEQKVFVKSIYPWLAEVDEMTMDQIFVEDVRGKSIDHLRQTVFEPARNKVAHALLDKGETAASLDNMADLWLINKLLPSLRISARLVLMNDFPDMFEALRS